VGEIVHVCDGDSDDAMPPGELLEWTNFMRLQCRESHPDAMPKRFLSVLLRG